MIAMPMDPKTPKIATMSIKIKKPLLDDFDVSFPIHWIPIADDAMVSTEKRSIIKSVTSDI
jgi:hypothetical protein